MAFEQPSMILGVLPSNSDLSTESSSQFMAVNPATAAAGVGPAQAGLALATTGDPAIGLLQNNPLKNEAGCVMVSGVSKAIAATTISVGQQLMVSTGGKLAPATSGNNIVAIALEAAVLNDTFTVLLRPNGKV